MNHKPFTGEAKWIEIYVIAPACYAICVIAFFTGFLG